MLSERRKEAMAELLLKELAKSAVFVVEYPSGNTHSAKAEDQLYEYTRYLNHLPGKLLEVIMRFSISHEEACAFGGPLAQSVLDRIEREKKQKLRHAA